MSSRDDTCQHAEELAGSIFHRSVLIFKIVTCVLGLIGDIWIWKYVGTRWLAHPNARILYSLHFFWATTFSITYLAPLIFDLIRFLSPQSSNCDYLVSVFISFWIRFNPVFAVNAQASAIFALSVERLIATMFFKKYEKVEKGYLGYLFLVLSILFVVVDLYILIVKPNKWQGVVVATSIITQDNTDIYNIHLLIQQILECVTLFMFLFTFLLNRIQARKVKIHDPHFLNFRYQIKETSRVVSALLPCFCLHFIIFFAQRFSINMRRSMDPPMTPVDSIRWIEVTSQFQLYSLFMPLIIYLMRRKEKKRAIVNFHSDARLYFEQLAASWAIK